MASWKGDFAINEDMKQEVELDSWGVAGGTLYFWGPFSLAAGFMIGLISHPEYPWLYRKKGTASRGPGNYADIRITFEGVPPNTQQYSYRTTGSTSTEPIESNPSFANVVGTINSTTPPAASGYVGSHGATFDLTGKFLGFYGPSVAGWTPGNPIPTTGASQDPKIGLKSYLAGSLNYEETLITGDLGDVDGVFNNLGYVDEPDSSNVLPDIEDNRNWLLGSGSADQIGVYALGSLGGKVMKQWKLSVAAKPWDSDFYSPPTS